MKNKKRNRGIVELKSRYGRLFILPWVIGIIIFFIIPFVQSVVFSFIKIEVISGGIERRFMCF